jgi:hypothetical protein
VLHARRCLRGCEFLTTLAAVASGMASFDAPRLRDIGTHVRGTTW